LMLRCKKLDYSPSEPAQKKVQKVHPEREEKPVVQPTAASSEEVHGGDESTASIPFSPSPSPSTTRNEQRGVQTQKEGAEEVGGPNGGEEREEAGGVCGEGGDARITSNAEGEDEESDGDGFEEDAEASEGNGEGRGIGKYNFVGEYNTEQVVDLGCYRRASLFLATEFYRLLEMFMEEKTKVFDSRGADEFNVRRLLLRPYERKPLSHYRQAKIKDGVVVILDNSGSMEWWAEELRLLASIALVRGDAEVYVAPNGAIQARLTNKGYVPVDHNIVQKLRGRKIVYVGDFDGANTPIVLSWSNDVIWICPEARYRRFESHDWVHYREEDFKGAFLRVWTLDEMFNALRKVDRFYNLWIDFHENYVFSDDVSDDEVRDG
jgi:hypothetical protein